jgi:flagellar basal-body rod protein FlgB
MDLAQNEIFGLAEQRLRWLDNRQIVLASNIANLDTPGYVAQDQPDFSTTLSQTTTTLTRTDPRHLGGPSLLTTASATSPSHSLDGNAVTLEDQLTKLAETDTDQRLATTIYKEYISMFNIALGRSSG